MSSRPLILYDRAFADPLLTPKLSLIGLTVQVPTSYHPFLSHFTVSPGKCTPKDLCPPEAEHTKYEKHHSLIQW